MSLLDRFQRPLRSLRVSVTDRCNLRCQYCMPEPDYVWLPRESILTYEETATIVDAFTEVGVDRVRITGGEPLLRRDLPVLIQSLAARRRIADLALTTNGILLAAQARALREAGLHRITVSLDTLHRGRFQALTRSEEHAAVLAGIDAAAAAGFASLKLDTVVMRGVNEDELVPLIEYSRTVGAEVRFIEYMDVGGATRWTPQTVVSRPPSHAVSAAEARPSRIFRMRIGTIRSPVRAPVDGATTGKYIRTRSSLKSSYLLIPS